MQTEVPTLPVVHFDAHKNSDRKQNSNLRTLTVETKINSLQKNIACLSSRKRNLHPLLGQPYQSSVRQQPSSKHSKHKRNSIEQRVLSAKMIRIKELQNQLADAHYQLNELTNENKLLKALQKKQDSALKRYEGTNAELPRLINSHHEELRVLQIKYKKLKALHKETSNLLKEKENELQQLQTQNKHLLQLSKDRNLGEREKLQLQVSELNHRIEQQQDTIQTLHRKLTLESKSLKHQLHVEISKRKETQKHLEETIEKLKSLEHLLDNRERKLYYNGQLLLPDKDKRFRTQSLTNLRDISSSNPLKLSDGNKKWQTDTEENSLPLPHSSNLNNKTVKVDGKINLSQTSNSEKTETMVNLDQVRKYRLQKSSHSKILLSDSEEKSKEVDFKVNKNLERLGKQEDNQNQCEINGNKFRKMYLNEITQEEFTYSSEGSENENERFKDIQTETANNSEKLQTRLISSADGTSDSKELTFSNCKCRDKLAILVQERKDFYESDSEVESEVRKELIKRYLSNHQNDAFKLISPTCDDQTHYNSDKEVEKLTTSCFSNESQKIYRRMIENENFYNAQYDIDHTNMKQIDKTNTNIFSEDLQKCVLEQSVSEEQENKSIDLREDEVQNTSLLQTRSMKQHNQFETSFKTTDKIEVTDIEPEILSNKHDILPNDSQTNLLSKSALNTFKNLSNEEITNIIHGNETETANKNMLAENCNIETKNKLNKQEFNEELQNVDVSLNDGQSYETFSHEASNSDVITKNKSSTRTKVINYNKEKLLATMRAIDDNENIEFLDQVYNKHNITTRKQITENLFRGLPTHAKKKQDIIKDIFEVDGIKSESANSYNKLH